MTPEQRQRLHTLRAENQANLRQLGWEPARDGLPTDGVTHPPTAQARPVAGPAETPTTPIGIVDGAKIGVLMVLSVLVGLALLVALALNWIGYFDPSQPCQKGADQPYCTSR
jgi:hypothetical protein